MHRFYMIPKIILWRCFVITMRTKMFNTLMYSLYVPIQTSFLYWLVVTLRTGILNNTMYTFYMYLQNVFWWSLVITIKTRMFFTLMHRFYMIPKIILWCCFVVTMRTRMFNTIMNRFMWVFKFSLCVAWWSQCGQEYLLSSCNDSMCLQTSFSCCLVVTMRTRILNNIMYPFYMYLQIVPCISRTNLNLCDPWTTPTLYSVTLDTKPCSKSTKRSLTHP